MVKVSTPEENKKAAENALKEQKENENKAKSSAVPNKVGKEETFVIDDNKGHKFELVLRYPGTLKALEVIEDSKYTDGGGTSNIDLFNNAIDEGIVVAPKEMVQKKFEFFDNHNGYGKVVENIAKFLGDKLG